MLHIFVDADSCPVKEEVYRVAARCLLEVTLVANSWMRVPDEPGITLEIVGDDFDAADDWIAEQVEPHDIVITADILLANRCLQAGASVVGPTGKLFTESNIGQAVATRDLLADLRCADAIPSAPPPMTQRDRTLLLQSLDQVLQVINLQQKSHSG